MQVKFTKVDIDNEELSGTVSGHQITGVVSSGALDVTLI